MLRTAFNGPEFKKKVVNQWITFEDKLYRDVRIFKLTSAFYMYIDVDVWSCSKEKKKMVRFCQRHTTHTPLSPGHTFASRSKASASCILNGKCEPQTFLLNGKWYLVGSIAILWFKKFGIIFVVYFPPESIATKWCRYSGVIWFNLVVDSSTDSPNSFVINSALMFLVGFFIGGAANLISSAVSADLGM